MIDFNTFCTLYEDAKACDSEVKYVMERGWQEWMSEIADTDKIADVLRRIYTMANEGFAAVVRQYKKHAADVPIARYPLLNGSEMEPREAEAGIISLDAHGVRYCKL